MINLSTPYAKMHREFWQEFDKQEYWVGKWQKQNKHSMHKAIERALCTESKLIDRVEYNKEKGNRWINYIYAQSIVNRRAHMKYTSVCYWEGYGSFGTFSAYQEKEELIILISTTHYWQRYCERTNTTMQGVHTAMNFFSQHPSSKMEIMPPAEGDTRRQICIHYTCGAAYGVEVSEEYHIFELRTFIANATMAGQKGRNHKAALAEMYSDNVHKGMSQINTILKHNKGMTALDALQHVSSEYYNETYTSIATEEEKFIRNTIGELRQTLSHEQAVEECMKHPMLQGSSMPEELIRLHIATNDIQNNNECMNYGFKQYIATIENGIGEALSWKDKKILKCIYDDGFNIGANVIKNYFVLLYGADYRFQNQELTSLPEYKHYEYLKMKQHYEKVYAKCPEGTISAIISMNARGFDDGTKHVSAMVTKYFGINLYYSPTPKDY